MRSLIVLCLGLFSFINGQQLLAVEPVKAKSTIIIQNRKDVLQLINQQRAKGYSCKSLFMRASPSLEWSSELAEISKDRIREMFSMQYFEHQNPQGKSVINQAQEAGYQFSKMGENLMMFYLDSREEPFSKPKEITKEWLKSNSGHCENMLQPSLKRAAIVSAIGFYQGEWVEISVLVLSD